jgi:multidrug efflux system membrane fusion protein
MKFFRRPVRQFCLCFLLLLPVFVVGCSRSSANTRAPVAVPVQTAKALRTPMPLTQKAIGTVQSLRSVSVKSQVDGIIKSVNFREGDEVQAGDLLVTLDRRPFENSLQIARADLANAQAQEAHAAAEAERYHQLDQASVVSKEQYAQLLTESASATALVEARKASVANAQLQLDYTEIRAPIAGRTGQLLLHEGALVKANDSNASLVTINQLSPIAVAFSVPEGALDLVKTALAAGKIVARVSNRTSANTVEGVVDFVDNTVDPTTGMITLKARFENAEHALWPGQFVNIEATFGSEIEQVAVPTQAVQAGQKGPQVYVVKTDKTVELRQVTVGRAVGDLTAILKGVAEGEIVVTDGQLRLLPGMRIEERTLAEAATGSASAKVSKP